MNKVEVEVEVEVRESEGEGKVVGSENLIPIQFNYYYSMVLRICYFG